MQATNTYSTFYDSFVAAIFHAYNNHQLLRLSPDVWLAIAQDVSHHINYNAEKFRSRFVNHEGKKDIVVPSADILYETSHYTLEASRIVLLDTVKIYFKHIAMLVCGIPKVTLEGTLEDWIKIQKKVIQLRKLNLELDFWLDRLDSVIWNLVVTYRGEID
ncbi:10592_t:CDS:2 [Cetraspora pellucida]|uniref:10592_t:CDS:1 n=1 Tax=Cetraspora pellucida TaxID=1433469 RepID=A0A9N9G912_9GLOM|nr:10592_t:CDS:2 [Cetraspora pellucida]